MRHAAGPRGANEAFGTIVAAGPMRAREGRKTRLNEWILLAGLSGWKPVLTALLLPPVPLLALILIGALLLQRRRAWGWVLLLAGAAAIWLSCTSAIGDALQRRLTGPLQALSPADLQDLQKMPQGGAIVVLGAGTESHAPEYDAPSLAADALQRLRYGLWLSRRIGWPVALSGGTGHAQASGPAEAVVAAQIAERDFGRPPKWVESDSRDTRENAERSVSLLRAAGVTRIVLVTHGWHMRRSLRAFEQAIARRGGGITLTPAPMGLAPDDAQPVLRWLPSQGGFKDTRQALREYLALALGA